MPPEHEQQRGDAGGLYRLKRWMYRSGRPNALARVLNRISAVLFSAGYFLPSGWIALEVRGRRTGKAIVFPLVAVTVRGHQYVVSMLGQDAGWVKNLRAAQMRAVLHHRGRYAVELKEVPTVDRAPILRNYLNAAPGARPHIPLDRRAPVAEFAEIAADYPVFRMVPQKVSS